MGKPYLFISFYLLAGLTDVLDGYIARKLKVESILGARLDSVADFFLYGFLVYYLITQYPELLYSQLIFIIIIISIRLINILIGIMKFKKLVMIHTIANKLSGLLVYFLPILLWINIKQSILIVLIIALLASIEEMLIILKSKKEKIQINQKSIFYWKSKPD